MSIVGAYTGGNDGGTSGTSGVALTPPAGMAVGDTIIVGTIVNGSLTCTTPAGYTLVSGPDPVGSVHTGYCFRKTAVTADLTATVTLPWSSSAHPLATGFVERGAYDAVAYFGQSSGANITPAGVSATAGDDVVVITSVRSTSGVCTLSTPVGYSVVGGKATAYGSGANFATATVAKTVGTTGTYGSDAIALGGSPLSSATYTIALTPTATALPASGTASGTTSWVGAAVGVILAAGVATGATGWVGSAVGQTVRAGTAAGSTAWVGSATGSADRTGTATGTTSWVGSATGTAPVVATATGTASGSTTWAGAATGARPSVGTAQGSTTWDGQASGATDRAGTATGGTDWTGTASGSRPSSGVASGNTAWAGSASGFAPAVGGASGSATGTTSWAGVALGATVRQGSATGATDWVGAATGARASLGTATGDTTWTGAVAGFAPAVGSASGTATGTTTWAGTASGSRPSTGTAQGGTAWIGSASGTAPAVGGASGSAAGSTVWAGSASGSRPSAGTASGTTTWDSTAVGTNSVGRDITWLGFDERQRRITYLERQRTITFTERQRTITYGGTLMRLNTHSVEYYDPGPSLTPTDTDVEASFDAGLTWVAPTTTLDGRPVWLVQGPDAGGTATLISVSVRPWLRVVDNPETLVRYDAPRIYLV